MAVLTGPLLPMPTLFNVLVTEAPSGSACAGVDDVAAAVMTPAVTTSGRSTARPH
jgi:hypothetical protein